MSGNTSDDICSQCLTHGATGFSVSTISEAVQLATMDAASINAASIFVSLPPAFSEIQTMGAAQQPTTLLLTIDHFVQAEELAKYVSGHRKEQQVVILLQGDQPGPGVRPGLDALRLAQGVNGLAGIRVIGISATPTNDRDTQPAIKSAAHTQTMLRSSGIDCDFISISGSADLLPTDNAVVTEIRDPRFLRTSQSTSPTRNLTAEVISRPSLEIAILNIGHILPAAIGSIRLPDFPDAELSQGPDNCCVVNTNGNAQQLKIGDIVRIGQSVAPNSAG